MRGVSQWPALTIKHMIPLRAAVNSQRGLGGISRSTSWFQIIYSSGCPNGQSHCPLSSDSPHSFPSLPLLFPLPQDFPQVSCGWHLPLHSQPKWHFPSKASLITQPKADAPMAPQTPTRHIHNCFLSQPKCSIHGTYHAYNSLFSSLFTIWGLSSPWGQKPCLSCILCAPSLCHTVPGLLNRWMDKWMNRQGRGGRNGEVESKDLGPAVKCQHTLKARNLIYAPSALDHLPALKNPITNIFWNLLSQLLTNIRNQKRSALYLMRTVRIRKKYFIVSGLVIF